MMDDLDPAKARDEVIDAALRLAAKHPWTDVTLGDIAGEAALPMAELHRLFDGKQDILLAFSRRMDRVILAEDDPGLGNESARDRLFDVLMRRFDAMEANREALRSIARDGMRDPTSLLRGLGIANESLGWMLEAARIDSAGLTGAVRSRGLALVMGATIRVWLRDDTPDLSKTMAELDRRLAQADNLIRQTRNWRDRIFSRTPKQERQDLHGE